jgi:hypothetical protein
MSRPSSLAVSMKKGEPISSLESSTVTIPLSSTSSFA